ncbi:hypothetical protein DL98DRAFT_443399, partial [Cadophora sp. DSE1049]
KTARPNKKLDVKNIRLYKILVKKSHFFKLDLLKDLALKYLVFYTSKLRKAASDPLLRQVNKPPPPIVVLSNRDEEYYV